MLFRFAPILFMLVPSMMILSMGTASAESIDYLVSPHRVAELAFGSPGVVRTVEVERGDRIGKGQALASLDTTIEQAVLDMAEAQFQATAAIETATAELDLAGKRLERNRLLLRNQNLAAVQFEEIEGEYTVARLKLAELEELRRLRALDVARAKAVMAQRTPTTPSSSSDSSRRANMWTPNAC